MRVGGRVVRRSAGQHQHQQHFQAPLASPASTGRDLETTVGPRGLQPIVGAQPAPQLLGFGNWLAQLSRTPPAKGSEYRSELELANKAARPRPHASDRSIESTPPSGPLPDNDRAARRGGSGIGATESSGAAGTTTRRYSSTARAIVVSRSPHGTGGQRHHRHSQGVWST